MKPVAVFAVSEAAFDVEDLFALAQALPGPLLATSSRELPDRGWAKALVDLPAMGSVFNDRAEWVAQAALDCAAPMAGVFFNGRLFMVEADPAASANALASRLAEQRHDAPDGLAPSDLANLRAKLDGRRGAPAATASASPKP